MKGQSLFEVIFALAIAAIVLIGVVSLAASSVRNSTFARNKALATRYTQEASEWLRGQRDANPWAAVIAASSPDPGTTWCLVDLSAGLTSPAPTCGVITGTIFTREVILKELPNPNEVEVTVTVDWTDSKGIHEVRTVTILTNWRIP